jgi:cytochrome P450
MVQRLHASRFAPIAPDALVTTTNHATSLHDLFGALVASTPAAIADPYSIYSRLRDEAPVYRYRDQVVVSGFEPVTQVLLDTSTFLSGTADLKGSRVQASLACVGEDQRQKMVEILEFRGGGLNWTNGETHDRLRALAHKAFTPRTVRAMAERIEEIADELLSKVSSSGQMEVISDLAFQLPLIVICDMLDVPREDRYAIRAWTNDIAAFQDGANPAVLDATHASIFALRDHLKAIFRRRRGGSTTDLMGALLAAEGESGDRFAEDELVPVVAHFVFAGHETTTNLIGNALRGLLVDDRSQWNMLREDPSLVPAAVEELLRYDSPVQFTNRTSAVNNELDGVPVRQWDTVTLVLGAANRDPHRFDQPNRIDITRPEARHVGFGLGPHFCLGAALTRLETSIVLEMLVRRYPDMSVATETITYRPDHRLRGVESLPVVLGPPRG